MKIKAPAEMYLKTASKLNDDQKEKLLCRMRGKLTRKWENEEFDTLQALAIQLELEDAELADWRKKMNEIKEKEVLKKNKK